MKKEIKEWEIKFDEDKRLCLFYRGVLVDYLTQERDWWEKAFTQDINNIVFYIANSLGLLASIDEIKDDKYDKEIVRFSDDENTRYKVAGVVFDPYNVGCILKTGAGEIITNLLNNSPDFVEWYRTCMEWEEKKKIILVSGKKGVGKSYYSKLITKQDNSEIVSFAKPLKEDSEALSKRLFGCKIAELNADDKEKIRPLLQQYGQIGRAINKEFWVNIAKDKIKETDSKIICIDDVRFPNELEAFSGSGYDVYWLKVQGESKIEGEDTDISETALDLYVSDIKTMIVNNTTGDEEFMKDFRTFLKR